MTQRFVICDREQREFYRSALSAAYPSLTGCELVFLGGDGLDEVDRIPPADAVIATMWTTAYVAAVAPSQGRRFYLVQDHEPTFYPAAPSMRWLRRPIGSGSTGSATPSRSTTCTPTATGDRPVGSYRRWTARCTSLRAAPPPERPAGEPVRIFVYARPGHWRNCWEIAEPALHRLKERHGDNVHIVTAGSWATSADLGGGIEHLGLMDVRSTGELYRRCDIGVALTVSEHPSYLPGELMACGVPVVAFDLPEAEGS
ncbi:MAG: glycosyltransferase [Microthrixaceae bacterium]